MSSHPSDKYRMFRNYMANELGIGREDIEYWVKETVEREVKKILDCNPSLVHKAATEVIKRGYWGSANWEDMRRGIIRAIADQVKLKLTVEPTTKEEEDGIISL